MSGRPMTLGEIVRSEEREIVNIADIKVKCFEFAIEVVKVGVYQPNEVMEEAKKIFDWVMDNGGFEQQT